MKRIPVYTISGFLGSGKTTVLGKMVNEFKKRGEQVGIILNELGDENVEKHLFEDQTVHELLNGCICCTIQDDLISTLKGFLEGEGADVLLIEGTGVANPLEIKDILLSPELIEEFELMSMIGIVDASHYLDYQSMFASSKEIRSLLKEQIISSDFIILNKIDMVNEKEQEKVRQKIEKVISPGVEILAASYGDVPFVKLAEQRQSLVTLTDTDGQHHHHHSIATLKIAGLPAVRLKKLETWLKGINGLIRAKGYLYIEGKSELREMQFASKKAVLSDSKVDTEKTVLILIGQNLNAEEIKTTFNQSFL
ncbi:GTP-binding protein [Metabacillus idriensis]|uniref:CobW family GTP-binding protein n=1 Tax=Metabacillus idriensis TaxID=324768 RepID=UPI0020422FE3|nr:GTP-binding protein [Metabacillus idriensis]MCM3596690.1 GTP-binding protein [Metabacillus idriensis]